MTASNSMLVWLVEVLDKGSLPTTETLRIKSLLDDLNQSIQRAAFISTVPVSEELSRTLKDLQHTSTYIQGSVLELSPVAGKAAWNGGGIVPSHMDQSFAGKQPIHIENLVANNVSKGMENVKQFASVSQVDLLQKGDFEDEQKPPAPGEVENFVAQRESESVNEDVQYSSIEEVVELFATDPSETFKIGKRIHVEWNPSPLVLDKIITLSPIEYEVITTAKFIGMDYDTNELIVVLDGETNEVYRIGQSNLLNFIGDLNIYDDKNFATMFENIKAEARAKRRNKPERYTFSLYSLGENYVMVNLNIDGSYSTFVTTRVAVEANLKA